MKHDPARAARMRRLNERLGNLAVVLSVLFLAAVVFGWVK